LHSSMIFLLSTTYCCR